MQKSENQVVMRPEVENATDKNAYQSGSTEFKEDYSGDSGNRVVETDTPFRLVRQASTGKWWIVLGDSAATMRTFDTEKDAMAEIEKFDWLMLGSLIYAFVKKFNELEK